MSDGWISVKERLPEIPEPDKSYSTWCGLVFNGYFICEGRLERNYFKKKLLTWKNAYGRCIVPTHWREFPAPPKEEA